MLSAIVAAAVIQAKKAWVIMKSDRVGKSDKVIMQSDTVNQW